MGFKFSLWIFSINAISIISWSLKFLIIAGIVLSPAILEALVRRSPATNSYPLILFLTIIG